MAAIASGVALSFGLIATSVKVEAAALTAKKTAGNVTVCDTGHPPAKIRQPRVCDACATIHDSSGEIPFQQTKKARPVEGGFVVLKAEEIAEASEDVTRFKKKAAVTAHPAEQVALLTSSGDKLYYLTPEAGHEDAYATLLALVVQHPELAFIAQWTPRTALGQFQLSVHDGVLVFQERVEGSGLRPAPSLDLTFNAPLIEMAEAVLKLPASVSDYDPATYRSTYEERIAAIVEGKEVVTVEKAESTTAGASGDQLMAQLEALLAAESKPKPKRAPRKKKEEVSA